MGSMLRSAAIVAHSPASRLPTANCAEHAFDTALPSS
jgi:hypothetical protein